MSEIFTKKGDLRKHPPKKYLCRNCKHKTSIPKSINTGFASFYICDRCGGSIKESDEYTEWTKRKSGQWDLEQNILQLIKHKGWIKLTDLEELFMDTPKFLFNNALGDICYNQKVQIVKDGKEINYYSK